MANPSISRRTWMTALAATGLTRALPASAADFCRDAVDEPPTAMDVSRPLGEMNRRVGWGVAIGAPALYDPVLIERLVSESPRFLAIANALKFGDLSPHSKEPSSDGGSARDIWKECDDIVALATRLRIPVRGDCLAWNDWLPKWVTDTAEARAPGWQDILRASYEDHFRSVFDHFASIKIKSGGQPLRWCGLVNEPFNPWAARLGSGPGWRKGPWLDAFGIAGDGVPGYIHRAFELGERLAPRGTALFLNETYCDEDRFGAIVRPAMLRLVDTLQRAGRRVDAIGLECHLMPQWMKNPGNPDWTPFVAFLKELSKRGVEIYLTELDVNDCSLRDQAARDALVESYVRSFVSASLEVPSVKMITNWDFSDKYSWWRGDGSPSAVYPSLGKWADCVANPPCPRPDLYDQDMRPKPARRGLAAALAAGP